MTIVYIETILSIWLTIYIQIVSFILVFGVQQIIIAVGKRF